MTDLPASWAHASLGELSEVIRGVTYQKSDASAEPHPDRLPMLRATNITGGLDLSSAMVYLARGVVGTPQILRRGDIVVAASSGSISVVGKSAPLLVPWEGTFGAFCACIRPLSSIEQRYLAHFVRSPAVRQHWSAKAAGTNINNLKRSDLLDTEVPVPPLAEQRRIVDTLDDHLCRLDAATALLRAAKQRATKLRAAVLDQETRRGADRTGRLADLLDGIEAGKSFTCEGRPVRADEWGVIKVSAMTWAEFRQDENKAVIAGREIDPRHEIHAGDILVSRANTEAYVGAPVLVRHTRPRLLLSDKSLRLLPAAGVDREWLIAVLASPGVRRQISDSATGTKDSMRNISQKSLLQIAVPITDPDRQRLVADRISEALRGTNRMVDAIDSALGRAGVLRRSLLDAAFSGRLVPQDPADEPAELLLKRIAAERETHTSSKPSRKRAVRRPSGA